MLATIAEVPPVVSLQSSFALIFHSCQCDVQVFIIMNLNRDFCLSHLSRMPTELFFLINIRPLRRRAFLSVIDATASYPFFIVTQMFQPQSSTAMVIAATRMHRSLVDFNSRSTDVYGVLYSLPFSDLQGPMLF